MFSTCRSEFQPHTSHTPAGLGSGLEMFDLSPPPGLLVQTLQLGAVGDAYTLGLREAPSRAVRTSHRRVASHSSPRGTVAHQAPLTLGFSGPECWSGLPCPSPKYSSTRYQPLTCTECVTQTLVELTRGYNTGGKKCLRTQRGPKAKCLRGMLQMS